MKALLMLGPGSAEIAQVPSLVRKPGEALLRVRYVGLCGTDRSTGGGAGDPRRLERLSSAVHKDPDLRRLIAARLTKVLNRELDWLACLHLKAPGILARSIGCVLKVLGQPNDCSLYGIEAPL